jgi:hypothetical protein
MAPWISEGEACLVPDIVSSEASRPVQQARTDQTLQLGNHFILQQGAKAKVNGRPFPDYIHGVFVAHRTILRQQREFTEEKAALLMDNCPSLVKQTVLRILTATVRIITFPPHATRIITQQIPSWGCITLFE